MIKEKTVDVPINNRNIEHFRKLNYDVKPHSTLNVKVEDLSKNSHQKITAVCDKCLSEQEISYSKYNINVDRGNFYTCKKCSNEKRKITVKKLYGVDHISQTDDFSEKVKKTKKERHGDENFTNVEKMKQTCIERYGYDSYTKTEEFLEKVKKTNQKNNGVDFPQQSEKIKEKVKQTCMERYGCDSYTKTEEFIEKAKKTKKDRYGDENFNNLDKNKNTKLERYGDEYYTNFEKIKQTNKEKYGTEYYMNSEDFRNKSKKTKMEKYENEYWNNIEKIKSTNDNKYGCENPMQNVEIAEKQFKSARKIHLHNETGLYYQSSYEKDFLDYCVLKKIKVKKLGKTIKYLFENKIRYYHPDFYLPLYNVIIEIKSEYTYQKDLNLNLAKKEASIENNFEFLFVIDKKYTEIEDLFLNFNLKK